LLAFISNDFSGDKDIAKHCGTESTTCECP
jgi:hypothetical protein